ncbi:regulatory protein GemA [Stenotrophomonas sp. GD03819]|jgi:phage gp16-like protein|uniref:gp16 family protein n=1 Tax=unclassified Stenotrophomonas TaxID=196198 RepID=UPI0019D6D0B2|nr:MULTISPECIES: regulatory protein GemA [unclassified Stenotrophomonas]MDH1792911.1 regulatory protein GemA [Stenotrophomonas sp. GD03819]
MKSATDPLRRAQIAKIKVAQKELGMDEASYRALLQRVTGKQSSTQMSPSERDAVLAELTRLGWKAKPGKPHPDRPKNTDQVPMLRKVEALLASAKRPWNYAHAMSVRMFQVDRLEFLKHDQLHSLIAALQIDCNRREG